MKVNEFHPKHGRVSLTVESAEDLWVVRRLISKGDTLVTRSSRVVKREDEYARPDKGERVKVTVSLLVDEVHLDSSIERIRVKGAIIEASDQSVSKAGSHSVTLSPGHSFTLQKRSWSPTDTKLVRPPGRNQVRFVLVAADRREAGIGTLSGSHLAVTATIESGLGGKQGEEQSPKPYIAKVADTVAQAYRPGDRMVIGGPGNFKNAIANQVKERLREGTATVIEGLDLTGADGVRAMVKTRSFQDQAKDSVAVELQLAVAEAVKRISSLDLKVAYSLPRVGEAAAAGAVETCIVSDDVFFAGLNEEDVVRVLNTVEEKGGSVYLADASMETGKQVSAFGGMVALLRYAVRP